MPTLSRPTILSRFVSQSALGTILLLGTLILGACAAASPTPTPSQATIAPVTVPAEAATSTPTEETAMPTAAPQDQLAVSVEPVQDQTQSAEEASVTVEVTPLTLQDAQAATLDFEISLSTHAVELAYDLTQIVVLRDGQGNEYRPTSWEGPTGGHHVEGILRFADRATILQAGVTGLELDLRGIADVPSRLFRWDVPQQ